MSDRLQITITGSNQSHAAFAQVTADAKSMGLAVEESSTRSSRSLTNLQKGFTALGASIGAGAIILGEFGKAAAADEASQARVQQAVENTGKAYEDYADKIDIAIKKGQEKAFSDDATRDALVALNLATNDTGKSIDLLGVSMDLARTRGIELSSAAEIIGKVYGGNLGILSRYGIQVDKNASSEEALAVVQQRTAGQAAIYADTTAGKLDILKDKISETTEAWGKHAGALTTVISLLPGVTAGWGLLAGAASGLTTAIAGEAGASAAFTILGVSIGTATVAALAFAPALSVIAYTAITATDNIHAVSKETDALNQSLAAGGLEADEFARRLYGLVSQGSYNVEYLDVLSGKVFVLEDMFGRLTSLRGEFQQAAIDSARALDIDFAQPATDDIQQLIDIILYYKRLQTEVDLAQGAGLSYRPPTAIAPQPIDPRLRNQYLSATLVQPGMTRLGRLGVSDLEASQAAALETATTLEKSLGAATQGVNSWSQAQAEADRQLQETLGGFYELATGVTTTGAALKAFKATQDGLIEGQQVWNQQLSEYSQQQSSLTAGRDILLKRQQEGVKLSKEEQDLLDNYPELYDRVTGGMEDATVQGALLSAQYIENMLTGDQMNESIKGQTESTESLNRTIENLILSMEGVPEEVKSEIHLNRVAEAQAAIEAYLATLRSIPSDILTHISVTGTGAVITGIGPHLHGGVVGYNNGGVVIRAGEAGPEYMAFANGGSAWAQSDGLYNVPRGTYITPAPASVGKSGSGLHFNGPVSITVVANDPRQMAAAINEWAVGSSRS